MTKSAKVQAVKKTAKAEEKKGAAKKATPAKKPAPKAAPAAKPATTAKSSVVETKTKKGFSGLAIKPGFVVLTEFSKKGGVRYVREEIREERVGAGEEREWRSEKKVDNLETFNASRGLVSRAFYAMDKLCASTPLGYYVPTEALAEVLATVGEIQAEAETFNTESAAAGSARRVEINVYPLEIRVDNKLVVERIARSVFERLEAVKEALRTGSKDAIDGALSAARNLDQLATGIQADAIRMALEGATAAREEVLERVREAAKEAKVKVKDLDEAKVSAIGAKLEDAHFEALDAAISLFAK